MIQTAPKLRQPEYHVFKNIQKFGHRDFNDVFFKRQKYMDLNKNEVHRKQQ